jgi:hypothetical protein
MNELFLGGDLFISNQIPMSEKGFVTSRKS